MCFIAYAKTSNIFISDIAYALDPCHQFTTRVDAVFSRNDRGLPRPPSDIEEIIAFILSQNRTHCCCLRDRSDSLRQIGMV
jgi:hypothetical protein